MRHLSVQLTPWEIGGGPKVEVHLPLPGMDGGSTKSTSCSYIGVGLDVVLLFWGWTFLLELVFVASVPLGNYLLLNPR